LVALTIVGLAYGQGVTEVTITRGCGSEVYDNAGICLDSPSAEERLQQVRRNNLDRERRERDRTIQVIKDAERKRAIDDQVKILGGEHRRSEAERFVSMREQATSAKPKKGNEFCKITAYKYEWSTGGLTDAVSAQAEYGALRGKVCQGRGGALSPIKCDGLKILGTAFVNCTSTVSCASHSYPCSSSRIIGQ
jgi:hypothetical protein